MASYVRNTTTRHLTAQKRMAMELMKVGRRGVWLDPERKEELAQATTRAQIRSLIEAQVIRRTEPRQGQGFVMPPQYMSRFRQRLLCDVAVRRKAHAKMVKPTSGHRYRKPQYWVAPGSTRRERPLRLTAGQPDTAPVDSKSSDGGGKRARD